ncbi:MAG: bifunctional metallophosphatase/5'-nucleotidase [Alistipes senegalensis]|nr:bifunctional metallophosphatase/5'-nucleotidase [Bacteroides cellulosilyticus]MCM1351969.1 bifunctional metallophosphatase/5'-nucleotidase [Alistipes senegalensis]
MKLSHFFVAVCLLAAAACTPTERTVVLLSTNDMHAQIDRFPQLAAAVEACRDTVENVVLVDAGDRWTGDPFVDRTTPAGMPIIRLMNRLGYDVATLGNHEFDHGQAHLGRILDSMDFTVVCSNVVSDTCTFPQLPPYTILERDGIRIGFVGAVTNYEGGHPAGHATSFTGLTFPDPQQTSLQYARELRPQVDLLVLVSHMGDNRDEELLLKAADNANADDDRPLFDVVIGGHTHQIRNSVVGGTLLTQTGSRLNNVGATIVRMRGRKVVDTSFRLVELAGYDAAEPYASMVVDYKDDPDLNRTAGRFAKGAGKFGIADWIARSIAAATKSEIGLYHRGGVRLDTIPAGEVSRAAIYALEPFNTPVTVTRMTPEELRAVILSKYNDTLNLSEAHRIDIVATTPYTLVTDAEDNAVDVVFPQLQAGRRYSIALNDYIYRNYAEIDRTRGRILGDMLVNEVLLDELASGRPVVPDNRPRQRVQIR